MFTECCEKDTWHQCDVVPLGNTTGILDSRCDVVCLAMSLNNMAKCWADNQQIQKTVPINIAFTRDIIAEFLWSGFDAPERAMTDLYLRVIVNSSLPVY